MTKTLREMAIEGLEKGNLQYLDNGICRKVYALTDDVVIKVEKIRRIDDCSSRRGSGKLRDAYFPVKTKVLRYVARCKKAIKPIKPRKRLYKDYQKFLDLTGFEANEASVEKFMRAKIGYCELQNLTEYLNYQIAKDNKKISNYLLKIYDYFEYDNKTIIIEERAIPKDVFSTQRLQIEKKFYHEGYELIDFHNGNAMEGKDGTIKVCDLGFCRFGFLKSRTWE